MHQPLTCTSFRWNPENSEFKNFFVQVEFKILWQHLWINCIFYVGRLLSPFHLNEHTCMHKTHSASLSSTSFFLSTSLPSTSYFGMFLHVVPGCLEAVCICMGEMVDRDGIWHAGTRSKRSIWSHKNRREPSSHPYKTPTDSQLCQPWLLHLLFSSVSRSRFSPPSQHAACPRQGLPDFAITPRDKQRPV